MPAPAKQDGTLQLSIRLSFSPFAQGETGPASRLCAGGGGKARRGAAGTGLVCIALCASSGFGEPPAASVSGDDHGAAVQRLQAVLEQRLRHASAELAGALTAKLTDRPKHGRTARVFEAAMATPLGFRGPLAALASRVAVSEATSSLDILRPLFREWHTQFNHQQHCETPALPPPANLADAVAQVRELAAATVDAQRDATTPRRRRYLANAYAALTQRLRDTISGAMRRAERRRMRRFVARLEASDAASAVCAAAMWSALARPEWLHGLRRQLASHSRAGAAVIHRETTPWGDVVLGGAADGQLRSRSLLFLADLGGDDFHGIDGVVDFRGHPQFVVDFAGDDRYESTSPGGYGAGVGRAAIVVDFDGDDHYQSGAHGQAQALLGVGALLDWVGNDRYRASHHAQGAAWFGVGVLFDGGGNDSYSVDALGQGVGLPAGLGVLLDRGGDDRYSALGGPPTNYGTPGLADAWAQGTARGLRDIAAGGVGLLVDFAGDDRYDAGSFAQGGAYYRGAGQLLDYGDGRDTVFGSRYNAGWGAHGGVGRFFNEGGDDEYATRHIVAGGLAWDYSLAIFHDAAGNDVYRLPGFSFGSAAHGSVGMFLDRAGDDQYHGAKPAQAQPAPPNVAVFFDGHSVEDVADGGWRSADDAPSCSLTGRHALVLLGADGNVPGCREPQQAKAGH